MCLRRWRFMKDIGGACASGEKLGLSRFALPCKEALHFGSHLACRLTRDFSQYPPNGELTRRLAPRAPLTLNSLLVRQNRKLSRINTVCICV